MYISPIGLFAGLGQLSNQGVNCLLIHNALLNICYNIPELKWAVNKSYIYNRSLEFLPDYATEYGIIDWYCTAKIMS
jgi:hypothetical protein